MGGDEREGGGGGGYGRAGPPWRFRGRAVMQLHAVRAREARGLVPPGLRLVEVAGWTLGAAYLARYTESPAGAFDELVVLCGLLWNPPGSAMWASRVAVSSDAARRHGVHTFGLPSVSADFVEAGGGGGGGAGPAGANGAGEGGWWGQIHSPGRGGSPASGRRLAHGVEAGAVAVVERRSQRGAWLRRIWRAARRAPPPPAEARDVVLGLDLPEARAPDRPAGPRVSIVMPNFSGRSADRPELLRYRCVLNASVRLVRPFRLRFPGAPRAGAGEANAPPPASAPAAALRGRPLLALGFDNLLLEAFAPEVMRPKAA